MQTMFIEQIRIMVADLICFKDLQEFSCHPSRVISRLNIVANDAVTK